MVEKQSSLLTSTLKTPETTAAFQQYVLEVVASGTSPHCYNALKLTFGNTIDAIKRERKGVADEQKALEAEKRAAIEVARREEVKRSAGRKKK